MATAGAKSGEYEVVLWDNPDIKGSKKDVELTIKAQHGKQSNSLPINNEIIDLLETAIKTYRNMSNVK